MLQQTRAEVVIPYFERWMRLFPSVQSLAEASWETVLKAWEGLGYYSRAQRLHQGAQLVVQRWEGALPQTEEELTQIPGLGPYTVAAIQAFAFHRRSAPVDGNVLRVSSRLRSNPQPIDRPQTQKAARQWLLEALPPHKPHEIAEALIELGATLCKPRQPDCRNCPLASQCSAHLQNRAAEFPVKAARPNIEKLVQQALICLGPSGLLLERTAPSKAFGLLWRFPVFESVEQMQSLVQQMALDDPAGPTQQPLGMRPAPRLDTSVRPPDRHLCLGEPLPDRQVLLLAGGLTVWCLPELRAQHTFVRTHCTLIPWMAPVPGCPDPSSLCSGQRELLWMPLEQLATLSFPSGHRSILQHLVAHGAFRADPPRGDHSLASSTAEAIHAGGITGAG